jgi:hypothetical protein
MGCRPTSRISDWAPHAQRTIAHLKPAMTIGRVHFMVIQIAACGCWAARRYEGSPGRPSMLVAFLLS